VWAWGANQSGQLGNGTTTNSDIPVQVSGLTGIVAIAITEHWMGSVTVLKSDGTVWAWGYNGDGEMGNGTTTNSDTPVQVSGLTGITYIAGGDDGGYAFKSDDTAWIWGYDGGSAIPFPLQVVNLTGVTAIGGGGLSGGFAIKADGTLWAWGYNADGELGNGSNAGESLSPVEVSDLTGVSAASGGQASSYALRSDGTVWAWGYNGDGELGTGTTTGSNTPVQVSGLTSATAIAAGDLDGYALKSDGTVWAWGYNGDGELGNGTTVNSDTPVQVSGLTGVVAIAGGGEDGYALKSDGTESARAHN
jgi:alpha-tubulin suppressor-like RCC1 family protein